MDIVRLQLEYSYTFNVEHSAPNMHWNTTPYCKPQWTSSRYSTIWPAPLSTARPISLVACIRQPCGAPFTRSLWRLEPCKNPPTYSIVLSIAPRKSKYRNETGMRKSKKIISCYIGHASWPRIPHRRAALLRAWIFATVGVHASPHSSFPGPRAWALSEQSKRRDQCPMRKDPLTSGSNPYFFFPLMINVHGISDRSSKSKGGCSSAFLPCTSITGIYPHLSSSKVQHTIYRVLASFIFRYQRYSTNSKPYSSTPHLLLNSKSHSK